MSTPTIRQRLLERLNECSDEQLAALLAYVEAMQAETLPEDYDEAKDPTIGLFSGPPDLASRTTEILRKEFGLKKRDDEDQQ